MDLTARRDTTSVEEVMERRAVSAPARGALGARPFDAGETPQAVSCIRVSCSSPFDTREVRIAGVTAHPKEQWMMQVARNATMEEWGFLKPGQYLIHDRDSKYCDAFSQILDDAGVQTPSSAAEVSLVEWLRGKMGEISQR